MKYTLIFIYWCAVCLFLSCKCKNLNDNMFGELSLNDNTITLTYNDEEIFSLDIDTSSTDYSIRELKDERDGKINQVFTITSVGNKRLVIKGTVTGSEESFACEADRRIEGVQLVRHCYGPSHSRLNRAVYDRQGDWLISFDQSYTSENMIITPDSTCRGASCYNVSVTGNQVTVRFRPHYYRAHRGLAFFEPSEYKVWHKPVAGWCSWFAYKTGITEENIKRTADVIAETMLPYGLEYLQIDDGYQQSGGQPDTWTHPNDKFPSGLEDLASYISSKGLIPGIWTNVAYHDSAWVSDHRQWFVTDEQDNPSSGRWIGYLMDGSVSEALDSLLSPVYSHFSNTGWQYFKLDALRHLLFEGYNSHNEYFTQSGFDREVAFRNVVRRVREDIGEDKFLLACWGVLPAVVGLADGCRIGNDGFGYTALAQYNSFNNVVWRNDPDHIELTPEEAYRSCMTTSLTGSLFMVTDKPEVYFTDMIIPAQKSIPVLFTMPGQVFDLDPSRSMMLDRTMTEMSGSGERAADGNRTSPFDLFMLELNTPWDNWIMLGRTGEREKEITLTDLGLDNTKEYLVFEFWSGKFLGTINDKLVFSTPDPEYNCQLFCIREKRDHPQILATDRHISCGAYDLSEVKWEDNTLSAISRTVKGDDYSLIIYEPEGYKTPVIRCEGYIIKADTLAGRIRRITLASEEKEKAYWSLTYSK